MANDPAASVDIDLTRSTCGVWLVKMPKYLSQILSEQNEVAPNGEIGRLVKRGPTPAASGSSSAGRAPDVVFRLNDQIMERLKQQNTSKDYQLPPREHRFCLSNISDGVVRTVYTRTPNNSTSSSTEQIALVGKVIQRAEVRPVENEQYMSMKRKHIELSQMPSRRAVMISKTANAYVPITKHADVVAREKLKKQAGKRTRQSEDSVLDRMLEVFEKNQFISMANLEVITEQPKSFLQEIVKKYCIYNSRGHTYELKPEYRHHTSAAKGDEEEEDDDDDDDDVL